MKRKAMIAMSGGVDSSVAAHLMQTAGYACVGATMRLLERTSSDVDDARAVATRLGMPFHVLDFQEQFRQEVMDDFVRCYEAGLTPNPCIVCNRRLKFGVLLDAALAFGCDYVVTGHYAQITQQNGRYLLQKAADSAKDQSYFLYALTQQQIAHVRFPLGGLTKDEARQVAETQGFVNARKRDSQEICFIPDGDYVAFLQEFTGKSYPSGDFLDMDGRVVGKHQGAVAYTRGQRKGLGLAMGRPVYVSHKDMAANTVTVCDNAQLFSTTLLANDWNFFPFDHLTKPIRCKAKARSRMAEQPATVYPEGSGVCRVVFDEPQRALTTGQAVVLYDGDTVIGGGTITHII
ncbi:MAG: tRNA 2-thiouridine(34) synthase MnmA [Oscillospiraceae bacterium]|nr:tRNA 2-thiouridine(34) synthase MnmA [Oscillospiraceae bacterium]